MCGLRMMVVVVRRLRTADLPGIIKSAIASNSSRCVHDAINVKRNEFWLAIAEIFGGLNKVARRRFKVYKESAPDMASTAHNMWHPTLAPATSERTGRSCSRPPSSLATHVAPFALWT